MEVTFSINHQKYTSNLSKNFILFYVGNKFCSCKKQSVLFIKISVKPCQVPIETSLLVFIRSHARLTGTKFMCLEGGCGACIVNISGIKTPPGECRTMAVNSVRIIFSIQFSSVATNQLI